MLSRKDQSESAQRESAHRYLKMCYDQTGAFIGSLFEIGRPDVFVIVGTGKEIGEQIDSIRILVSNVKWRKEKTQ